MNMQRVVCILVVSIAFCAACSSSKQSKYQAVANAANPTIAKLRAVVGPVLTEDQSDTAVVSSCLSAEDSLRDIQDVNFNDRDLSQKIGQTDASTVIRSLIEMRRNECKEDAGDGTRTRRCRNWCVERWGRLADALERLHAAAKVDGVEIEQLRAGK